MSRRHHEFGWLIVGVVLAIVCLILLPAALRAIARGDDRSKTSSQQAAQVKQFAIHLPCEVVEVVDGDTVTCRLTLDVRVRLLDCWAPELRGSTQAVKEQAVASKKQLESAALHKPGGLFVLLDGTKRLDDLLSFGRVLGRVWVQGVGDLSSHQVSSGQAYRRKVELQKALTTE